VPGADAQHSFNANVAAAFASVKHVHAKRSYCTWTNSLVESGYFHAINA